MWLVAEYRPVTLFSLKLGTATSTGAKSLLIPTPFAIRTALLDAAIRTRGLAAGEATFLWLKELSIAVHPPERAVVTNLFTKVQKPSRQKDGDAMQKSIAFREYVYLEGSLALAFEVDAAHVEELAWLLGQVNYFGKRGSLFQLATPPRQVESLPAGFIRLDGAYLNGTQVSGPSASAFPLGLIQLMDDWGPGLTFPKVNIYTREQIRLGVDRVRKMVVLPYRVVRSSRGFTLYERMSE